jgi:hypothetical protein
VLPCYPQLHPSLCHCHVTQNRTCDPGGSTRRKLRYEGWVIHSKVPPLYTAFRPTFSDLNHTGCGGGKDGRVFIAFCSAGKVSCIFHDPLTSLIQSTRYCHDSTPAMKTCFAIIVCISIVTAIPSPSDGNEPEASSYYLVKTTAMNCQPGQNYCYEQIVRDLGPLQFPLYRHKWLTTILMLLNLITRCGTCF